LYLQPEWAIGLTQKERLLAQSLNSASDKCLPGNTAGANAPQERPLRPKTLTEQRKHFGNEQPACTLVLHTTFFIAQQGYAQASYVQAEDR